jgi:uncharacterized protein involved in exopolysaccharide biosynthesis
METVIPQASARDLAFILFRRKWSFLLVLSGAIIGAVIWLWIIRDDLFVTQAKVLVKLGREQAPPSSVVGATPMVVGYRSQDLNSEIDIFQSTEIIARVVDKYHLDKPKPPAPVPQKLLPRLRYQAKRLVRELADWRDQWLITLGLRERLTPRETTITILQAALTVVAQRDSNVFVAQLRLPERVGSSLVLSALLDEYLTYRMKMFETQGTSVFRSEVGKNEGALQKAEADLQDYEKHWDIASLEKQEEVLVDQIARARIVLRDAEASYQEALSKVQALDVEVKKPEPNFGSLGDFERDSFPQGILRQLADLQKEREKLRMTDLDATERVMNNRQQFQVLAAMLGANLRSVMAEKQANYELRKAAFEGLEKELQSLHSKQMKWAALKRKSVETEGIYSFYKRKFEENSAANTLEKNRVTNIAVIEHPMDAVQPDGMRKTMLLALAAGFALLAALAWVSIVEFFDHRVYTRDDLERYVSAPVLAVVERGKNPLRSDSLGVNPGEATYAAKP